MNRNILHKTHNFDCVKTFEYIKKNCSHKCVGYIIKQMLISNSSDYEFLCAMLHYLFNQYSLNEKNISKLRFMLHNINEVNNHYLLTYFVIEIKSII